MERLIKCEQFKTPWGANLKMYFREGTNDRDTITAVLVEDCYDLARLAGKCPRCPPITHCIDAGAHIGSASVALANLGHYVIAVEPLPGNCHMIRRNLAANQLQMDARVIQRALCDTEGAPVRVYYGDTDTKNGLMHEYIGVTRHSSDSDLPYADVKTISLGAIFRDHGIRECRLLKVDCEGCEWRALNYPPPEVLNKIGYIVGELHDGQEGAVTWPEFLTRLRGRFRSDEPPQYAFRQKPLAAGKLAGRLAHFQLRRHKCRTCGKQKENKSDSIRTTAAP